jgi:hypothetical protein
MSLFEQASLIVTPNAQKAGKLYSIKPTSGAGDLDVVRATSATRVDANGLVEIPRTNLLLRSEEFDNASWGKSASGVGTIAVTANYSTAPDGTLTADRLLINAISSGAIAQSSTVTSGVPYTSSIYAKSNTGLSYTYQLRDGFSGVLKTITITPDWQRFDLTFTSVGTTAELQLRTLIAGASDISIWGAQLEQGVSATEYIPTVASIRTRFAGITQDGGSASNIPRLDYTNGSCPSILVEPQITNLALRSEEFDNATFWALSNSANIIANNIISPDGTLNSDTLVAGANGSQVQGAITGTIGVTYTVSFYIKRILGTGVVNLRAVENASTPISITNEWTRVSLTVTSTSTIIRIGVQLATSGDQVAIWGAQLEVGSNATSYIPTVASSVTRNADVISKTGISDLIGQTEGTVLLNAKILPSTSANLQIIRVDDTTDNNRIRIITNTNQRLRFIFQLNGNVIQYDFTNSTNYTSLTDLKIAIAYKSGNIAIYINGVQANISSNTLTFSNTLSRFILGNGTGALSEYIDLAVLWKTRLSNAELQQLTTL